MNPQKNLPEPSRSRGREQADSSAAVAPRLLCFCLIASMLFWTAPVQIEAQDASREKAKAEADIPAADSASSKPAAKDVAASAQPKPEKEATANAEKSAPKAKPGGSDSDKSKDADAKSSDKSSDEVQLSFQGANIDMVVQWLAQTTGKSVLKHPRVQCQLTIVGSKKISKRDALNLVYRALSLEGFAVIETSKAIQIVPEGQEPKMSPELLPASRSGIPEGREK